MRVPQLYKLCFFVPVAQAEAVKSAIFAVGAGRLGHYDRCSWEVVGTGQFRPLAGSHPSVGSAGQMTRLDEVKVETVCEAGRLRDVVQALLSAHPYETPAYEYWPINPPLP